jgi:glycerol-3-phosphate dehydrogenase (NAD(P)+)
LNKRSIVVPVTKVAVLGAGSWGTTFSKILADSGNSVMLWARREELAQDINQTHRNSDYLRGISLPAGITATSSLAEAVKDASQIYLCVPSQTLRENLVQLAPLIHEDHIVISLMKGVEKKTGLRMSEVIAEELPVSPDRIAVASGPNLALEIAKEEPTAAVISSENMDTAALIAQTVSNRYFQCFVNTDVPGTEFGGVLKNLIAVAVGIVDGVGYGQNTKASIITRGLAEMTDFSVAYGAQPETLSGLAGLGDLIATCESPLSRNNTAGRLLGQGYTLKEVTNQMQQTAEGLASVAPVLALAKARDVDMPIVEQVSQVLAGTLDPRDIAPHLTTDTDEPQGERSLDDSQNRSGGVVWGSLKRAFNQLRNSPGSPSGD